MGMRLSEAIRLGALLAPQGYGELINHEGHTCALGAAYEAAGLPTREMEASLDSAYGLATETFPQLAVHVSLPCGCARFTPFATEVLIAPDDTGHVADGELGYAIAHLNDIDHWTRERIADWVETVEAKAEAPQLQEAGAYA